MKIQAYVNYKNNIQYIKTEYVNIAKFKILILKLVI